MSIASTLIAVSLLTGGNLAGGISDEHVNRLKEGTGGAPLTRVSCSFSQFFSNPTECGGDGFSSASRSRGNDRNDGDDDDHGNDRDNDNDRGNDRDSGRGNESRGGHDSNDNDHGKDGDDD